MLSLGFTMAYGAMFSKVWRVHRFTTKTKTDPKVCPELHIYTESNFN